MGALGSADGGAAVRGVGGMLIARAGRCEGGRSGLQAELGRVACQRASGLGR